MLNKVIIAEVQNGKLKLVMNIVHLLSIMSFVFSEQTVLMNGFSIGSPITYVFSNFFELFIPKPNLIVLAITIQVVKTIQFLK